MEKIVYGGGRNLRISFKDSVEVARWIKRRNVKQAMKLLEEVIEQKKAVPYRRYNKDRPHKPAVGPGRYPIKVAKAFIAMLKNIINSAKQKYNESNPEKLFIENVIVNRAISKRRSKRLGGIKATNVRFIVKVISK